MRLLLSALFIFICSVSFSQNGIDSVLNTNPNGNVPDSLLVNSDTIPAKSKSQNKFSSYESVGDTLFNNKKDSLLNANKKDIPGNNLKNKYENKIGEYKNDSLAKEKLKTTAKEKLTGVIPVTDVKDKLSSTKESVLTRNDSLLSDQKNKIKSFSPKAYITKQYKAMKPYGNISIGYEYGVLPSVVGDHYPSGGYKTEGNISFLIVNVPLELTYSYSDIKNTIGINNYFRLSYDANRYKEQVQDKLNVKDKLKLDQLNNLQLQQEELKQKIDYLGFLKSNPNYNTAAIEKVKSEVPAGINPSLNKDSLQLPISDDQLKIPITEIPKDSARLASSIKSLPEQSPLPKGLTDSIQSHSHSEKDSLYTDSTAVTSSDSLSAVDSTETKSKLKKRNEEVAAKYIKYKAKYDSVNEKIIEIQREIEYIKAVKENPMIVVNPYLSVVQSFMRGIKKVEIGLCHPTNSTFLVNNIPLQGINIEYGTDEKFITACYGTTVNNMMYNTNTLQGALQGARNMYNYFDFGNLSAGRKIFSLKGGIGKVDDSHLFAGFLIGKGRADYLSPLSDVSTSFSKESNVVIELDAKYKFTDNASLDIIVGKSSIKEEDLSMDQIKRGVNEIFSNYRSYAVLGRLNIGISRTKTKLTFSTRWIDPYFRSFGVGFLRSDNLRYEIKAEQPIGKKIKYTIAYRREEDNILKLFNYTNLLQSINNSLNIKVSRQINIRLNYVPLFRELRSSSIIIIDKNQIATAMLSYSPRPRKVSAVFNALYSRYIISGDSATINFENIAYSHMLQWKSGFKTGLNVSWFKNSLKDSLNNDTYIGVLDAGYNFKNSGSFSVGGKMAWKQSLDIQYGFVVKLSLKLYKGLFWEAEAEKILIGDYYNSFIIGEIKKFPYYCSTKLILKF